MKWKNLGDIIVSRSRGHVFVIYRGFTYSHITWKMLLDEVPITGGIAPTIKQAKEAIREVNNLLPRTLRK